MNPFELIKYFKYFYHFIKKDCLKESVIHVIARAVARSNLFKNKYYRLLPASFLAVRNDE